jgi:L-Ala-D/L-Glu epimerase
LKIAKIEFFPTRVAYRHVEVSSVIRRSGVCDTIVKITSDEGLVGWGECTRAADAAGIASAVEAMAPLLLGKDPWDKEAIRRSVFVAGLWHLQPMTGNFAYAGIDMALWDLCGKACGQPLYRLFGGAMREAVDYFYYLERGDDEAIVAQGQDGVNRGYTVFYLKVGLDPVAETRMLEVLRGVIGDQRRIRIDANQAWTLPEARRWLTSWHEAYGLDFAEAPVPIDPLENFHDLKRHTAVPLCVNEGLWRTAEAYRVIKSRCGDYLCYSPYWVGSLGRFHALNWLAHLEGWQVCKHTHGELGLAAAAGQHLMLAAPNACDGHQQTAQLMADDILREPIPIAAGPQWGRIEQPGLGVVVDEDKLLKFHEEYMQYGDFKPYGEIATC